MADCENTSPIGGGKQDLRARARARARISKALEDARRALLWAELLAGHLETTPLEINEKAIFAAENEAAGAAFLLQLAFEESIGLYLP